MPKNNNTDIHKQNSDSKLKKANKNGVFKNKKINGNKLNAQKGKALKMS